MKRLFICILISIFLIAGYASAGTYQQISQEKAKEMMEKDDGHIVVDVRRQDEFIAGHIPGAILIPNEDINEERPEELPDLDQIILIYCRSGNRSKQASEKLSDMGYTNIFEFGGINTWPGRVVKGGTEATLTFDSFDGGGPEYSVILDSDIVSYEKEIEYDRPDHEEIDGAGYTITYTFMGMKPGETTLTIEQRSAIDGNEDIHYSVKVDDNLNVTINQ